MLTTDLLRVRRRGGRVEPRYLRGADAARALGLAQSLGAVFAASVGRTRDELELALGGVEVGARDRLVGLGLRKLLADRGTFEVRSTLDPATVRRHVFAAAALAHREEGLREGFHRRAVLERVAAELGTTADELDAALFADLRGSERLTAFEPTTPEALVERYNVGLAQAVLLRATRVIVELPTQPPQRYRRIFRAARFHGLLHVVRARPAGGYSIELEGPFALFEASQRYGLKLAMFLPEVLACASFSLRAELVWGKSRERAVFEVGDADRLSPELFEHPSTGPDIDALREAFNALGSEWTARMCDRVIALPGEVACIPDLAFESRETGEEVFLEAFGFWSRKAVWDRIELIRRGFPGRIVLCIGKQLRVSPEVLDEDDAGELYVYRTAPNAKALLERLRRGAARATALAPAPEPAQRSPSQPRRR